MTRAAKPSRAEQMRRHREIFTYARAHDLTLIEAEKALVHAKWLAAQERLARLQACGTATPLTHVGVDFSSRPDMHAEVWCEVSASGQTKIVAVRQTDNGRPLGPNPLKGPPPPDAPWMMRD